MFQAYPAYFLLSPKINHFFKKPWFILVKNSIRNKARCAPCYWDIVSFRPGELTEQSNISV